MLQDPGGIVDHIFNDPLSRENLAYLGGDPTREPWPGTERLFWVLLEVVFDWYNALIEESLGFGLTVVLPDEKKKRSMDRISPTGISRAHQSST